MIEHITNARVRTNGTGKDAAGEKHPEKRMKAAYKAYGAFQRCRAGMVVGLLGLLVLAGSARRILSVAHTRVYTHKHRGAHAGGAEAGDARVEAQPVQGTGWRT